MVEYQVHRKQSEIFVLEDSCMEDNRSNEQYYVSSALPFPLEDHQEEIDIMLKSNFRGVLFL